MSIFEDDEFDFDEVVLGTTKPRNTKNIDTPIKSYTKNNRWFNSHNGFFMVPRAIREDTSINSDEFRVLITIGSYVMLKDEATPTIYTLTKQTGLKNTYIKELIKSLEEKGWLKIEESDDEKYIFHLIQPHKFKNKPIK